ncbi:MAG: 50S ribosomal protein L10 [Candidatus Omnitrophota bacterium]|nr:50S ribosomal protein L10 [Candidatus Omnitrophota bacterium]
MAKQGYGKLTKERMVKELLSDIKERPNFFITNYMGSSVSDLENVRKSLRPCSSTYFVVKNSILNVVLDQLKIEDAKPMVGGGVGVSLSGEDYLATTKALVNFAKTHEKFQIKGAYIDGKLIGVDKIKEMAALPSKEVLLARVVGGIKAPITGFVMVLGGIIRKFVYVVDAVKTSKEKAAPQTQTAQAAQ